MNFKNVLFFMCLLIVSSIQSMDWRPTLQECVEKDKYLSDLELKTYYKNPTLFGGYNKKDEATGDTILHLMAKKSCFYENVIEHALTFCASRYEKNKAGDTPLLTCIKEGNWGHADLYGDKLVVNDKDYFGITPIHYIIAFIQKEFAIEKLLNLKPDLDIKDDIMHKTPLQWIEYLENKFHIQKFENVEYGKNYEEFIKKLPILEKFLDKKIKFDKEELTAIKKMISDKKSDQK